MGDLAAIELDAETELDTLVAFDLDTGGKQLGKFAHHKGSKLLGIGFGEIHFNVRRIVFSKGQKHGLHGGFVEGLFHLEVQQIHNHLFKVLAYRKQEVAGRLFQSAFAAFRKRFGVLVGLFELCARFGFSRLHDIGRLFLGLGNDRRRLVFCFIDSIFLDAFHKVLQVFCHIYSPITVGRASRTKTARKVLSEKFRY